MILQIFIQHKVIYNPLSLPLRHVRYTCARHILKVICALDAAAAIAVEMELHSKVARLCLQTAKRPDEGERAREGWNRTQKPVRSMAYAAVYCPFLWWNVTPMQERSLPLSTYLSTYPPRFAIIVVIRGSLG